MKQTFEPKEMFRIPDGTLLSPFLNPKDSMSNLPFDLIDGFSMAKGIIEKNTSSKIHVHPHVDQVTFVLSGNIILKMKGDQDEKPYDVPLSVNQSAISIGGEFFQLVNPYNEDCHVLYIVSPAYLFEKNDDDVIYDDSIILLQTWDELKKLDWSLPELKAEKHSISSREKAYIRLKERKS